MSFLRLSGFFAVLLLIGGCQKSTPVESAEPALFTDLPADSTGVSFANKLNLEGNFDVFRYRNYYNGGGVAIGDVNGDGLQDIYFSANQLPNQLYINKGNFRFEEVGKKAGVQGTHAWSTGVAMADVNADGLLDIYVCNSGDVDGDNKENELFINKGDGTFAEEAARYGLADKGFSTHAVFFDYDKDGDLDCYVLNNSFRPISTLGLRNLRPFRDELGGDKLYRNDGPPSDGKGGFVDVSEEAGIYGSVIGFGLGVTVGDVNLDGWMDIYISNDFYERDYLYINQQDGTFRESLTERMSLSSHFSMGADMADLNNDCFPEIFVTDMLPDNLPRIKQTTSFLRYDEYLIYQQNGLYHQYMRNTLQWNNGDGTFSECSQLAGVHATDWSWGAILADLDNNGYRDVFVCNGVYKDVTDQDFVNFLAQDENIRAAQAGEAVDFKKFVDMMPSTPLPNYAFSNEGRMPFVNKTKDWGFEEPTHSNGAAYADLDNDGDLDIVISNLNAPAKVYRNEASQQQDANSLSVEFAGNGDNPYAIGARVVAYSAGESRTYEHMPMRGFQSSMGYRAVLGLGKINTVDSLVAWSPYGEVIVLQGPLPVNKLYRIDFSETGSISRRQALPPKGPAPAASGPRLAEKRDWVTTMPSHVENVFIDFDRDKLLYHALSTEGPALAVGDVNGDGREDFFMGGASGQAGQLFLQTAAGRFEKSAQPALTADAVYEDVDALFFDANGDGLADLLVASGGNEHLYQSDLLDLRLYIQQPGGRLLFERQLQQLPRIRRVQSCLLSIDIDKDGDLDIFVGGRINPAGYGLAASSYLLANDGKGRFTDVSARSGAIRSLGMVTEAVAADFNGDGWQDIALAGEWMPVTILYNEKGYFPAAAARTIAGSAGWWLSLAVADFNRDGKQDLVAGNWGLNSRFYADSLRPFDLYVHDFDNNGSYEQIYCLSEQGRSYPTALKADLGKLLPGIVNKQFVTYKDYMDKTVQQVFGDELLAKAEHRQIQTLATTVFYQLPGDKWQLEVLPMAAQQAPVYSIQVRDMNGDELPDLLLGGNLYRVKPELGRFDASRGLLLQQQQPGKWAALSAAASGLSINGEIRHIKAITLAGKPAVLIARNNAEMKLLEWQ